MNLEQQVELLTENIIKTNPTIVLTDGTTLSAAELNFDSAAHFEAFALQFKDEFKAVILSHQSNKIADESDNSDDDDDLDSLPELEDDEDVLDDVEVTREEKQKEQIDLLTNEIDKLRERMKKKFSAETWRELQSKTEQITDLKNRFRREKDMKHRQRERFLAKSFGTAEDFERLWNSTLRDEIMQVEAKTTSILRKHSLYQKF